MDADKIYQASYLLRIAAEHYRKWNILNEVGHDAPVNLTLGRNNLMLACAELGFELVPARKKEVA